MLNFTSQKFKTWTNECLHNGRQKEPSWCLLWSYWHANVAPQSIPPLPWFAETKTRNIWVTAIRSTNMKPLNQISLLWILKFWAMFDRNQQLDYKQATLGFLPPPCNSHSDTGIWFRCVRSEVQWGSRSLASDPGETGRKFSSSQRFLFHATHPSRNTSYIYTYIYIYIYILIYIYMYTYYD